MPLRPSNDNDRRRARPTRRAFMPGATSARFLRSCPIESDWTLCRVARGKCAGSCVDAPRICKVIFGDIRLGASIGRVSGLLSWPALRHGRHAVRGTGYTSVQRDWAARAPGLVFPILNIEVLAAYVVGRFPHRAGASPALSALSASSVRRRADHVIRKFCSLVIMA